MIKLLVLGAGMLQLPVIKKAKDLGYYVIAADGNPDAIGLTYADKKLVVDITDEEIMLNLAKKEQINGVIHPCSEVAMNVMGRINEELKLKGISKATAIRATNKHLMRSAFESNGAPSPKSFCTNSVKEGYEILKEIEENAIIKPSRSSGSRGITKILPQIEYQDFIPIFERSIKESRDSSVMIEEFIEGPEFSVEIIIWNGEVNVLQVTDKKTTGSPFFVELGHSQPSIYSTDIVKAVKEAAIKGVTALQLNNCAAHAEIKYHNGNPYIMEIGARLGGDFISTVLTQISTGIDMVAAAVNVALGIPPIFTPSGASKGVAIRYFTPRPGIVKKIHKNQLELNEYIHDAEIYVKEGDVIKAIESSLDRSGHVIVTANNVKKAIQLAEDIVKKGVIEMK